MVPLFIRDPRLLDPARTAARRIDRLATALVHLDRALREAGGRLIVRDGLPHEVIPAVAHEVGAATVHAARDLNPFGQRRDAAVAALVDLRLHPGQLIVEPEAIGEMRVFGAFHRRWLAAPGRPAVDAPRRIRVPDGIAGESLPALAAGLEATPDPLAVARAYATGPAADYARDRDRLDLDAGSRLSADLHFGTISARRLAEIVPVEAFRRQLAWRDWAHHLLWWHPDSAGLAWQPRLRNVEWRTDPAGLATWQKGETGFPTVDAAMRQLGAEGWIANRARLISASFLTKELFLDWRVGAAYYLRTLIDGDVANNACNWQWIAGVGTDPAPWFRVLDPTRQGERFDPSGAWVRRWLPELAGVPDAFIHRPWAAPSGPPTGYPARIVDRAAARERAFARFRAASSSPLAMTAPSAGYDGHQQ